MIAGYILSGHRGFGGIFASFGSMAELLPHHQQSTGQLLSIQSVIPNQEGLVSSSGDETCDIHCASGSPGGICASDV